LVAEHLKQKDAPVTESTKKPPKIKSTQCIKVAQSAETSLQVLLAHAGVEEVFFDFTLVAKYKMKMFEITSLWGMVPSEALRKAGMVLAIAQKNRPRFYHCTVGQLRGLIIYFPRWSVGCLIHIWDSQELKKSYTRK
jgi:hypothetical protein